MCRMIGVVSRTAATLDDLIGPGLDAFTALSLEHADGWGTANWCGDRLTIAKEPVAAHTSPAFAQAMTGPVTDAAIVHIRLANPGSPLIVANTHPFHAPGLAFAHNGHFSPAAALDDLLDAQLLADTTGSTDSERFFLLVRMLMRDLPPGRALADAAATIRDRATYSGLNCLLLTADSLYAYSESDPDSAVSRRRGPEYFPLNLLVRDDRVIVASTGWAQPAAPWQRLAQRQVLQIRRHDLGLIYHDILQEQP